MRMVPPHRGRGGHCCIDPQPVILTRDLPVRGALAEDRTVDRMLWPASGASRPRLTGDLAVKIAGHRSTQQCLRTAAPTTTSGRAEHNTAQRGHTAVRAPAEHRGGSPPVIPTDVRGNQRTSRRPGFGQRAPFEHRNVHMRPTKDLVDRMGAGQRPATGAPPGTRTPNPRIKRPKFTPSLYDHLQLHEPAEAAR
jgi:hypothetical protein